MAAPFPHHYSVSVTRTAPSRALVEAPPRVAISGGPPPELGGEPDRWSPEHLLLASIGLCLLDTFEALVRKTALDIASWASRTTGVLEKTSNGLAFSSFHVEVLVTVAASDLAATEALVARAKRQCIVSNALRAPVAVVTICASVGAAA